MENIKFTPEQAAIAQAIALLSQNVAFKDVLPTTTAQQIHGPGGLWSVPGMNQRVYNTTPMTTPGLLGKLRMRPTTVINPLQAIRLNQAANVGTHPALGSCGPCKTPGATAMGTFSFVFGQWCFSTDKIDLRDVNRLGAINNRGEFRDYQLIGSPYADNTAVPTLPAAARSPLNRELDAMMLSFAIGHQKEFGQKLWLGNPANNVGAHAEFRGLKLLINTGYVNSQTLAVMPAADSLVRSFSGTLGTYKDLDGTILNSVVGMYRKLNNRAESRGYNVELAIVVTEQLFYELSAIWPCTYATNRCAPTSGTANNTVTVNIDGMQQATMRDEMRSGQFLWIDGKRVPVTIDNSIGETALVGPNAGKTGTEIFFVPLSVNGAEATYLEYFDYSNQAASEIINTFRQSGESVIVNDGGRTLWVRRQDGFCVSMDYSESNRLIMETPWLAGRIQDIMYVPSEVLETGF